MARGFTLPLERGTGGYFQMSETVLEQVKSNFINLILTIPGERFNNPTFGCNIHRLVFDFNNDDFSVNARQSVEDAVERWMPYLQLEEFVFQPNNDDKNNYRASMYVKYRLSENPNFSDEVLIQFWGY